MGEIKKYRSGGHQVHDSIELQCCRQLGQVNSGYIGGIETE